MTDAENNNPTSPDDDAVKMFVGQLPKTWKEPQVRDYFKKYGPIYRVSLMRDTTTKRSKGCCFLTYFTKKDAMEAQNACHDTIVLEGASHPIQMKPADLESRKGKKDISERQIFVGMLSAQVDEKELRRLFQIFGSIEKCTVPKYQNGESKGCGFITFALRQSALNAIQVMNGHILEGSVTGLSVKFSNSTANGGVPKSPSDPSSYLPTNTNVNNLDIYGILQQSHPDYGVNPFVSPTQPNYDVKDCGLLPIPGQLHYKASDLGILNQLQQSYDPNFWRISNLGQTTGVQDLLNNAHFSYGTGVYPTPDPSILQFVGSPLYSLQGTLPGLLMPSAGQLPATINPLGNEFYQPSGASLKGAGVVSTNCLPGLNATIPMVTTPAAGLTNGFDGIKKENLSKDGKYSYQKEGPVGCNLFVYYLPQEYTDFELLQLFSPFGRILSAKVIIDKNTNRTKCYGFVSFDNLVSAMLAIQCMDKFPLGYKRLCVRHKRLRYDKPY